MAKIDHSDASWQKTGRVVLTAATGKSYTNPYEEQVKMGSKRRKLEDLKNEKAFEEYLKEIWE